MKKYKMLVLIFVVVLASASSAVIQYKIKYGETAILDFPLWDSNSPWALYETAPATADCNLFRNQGSSESLDNAVVDEGSFMSWTISAAEATCKTAILVIKDASAPPLFMDQTIIVTTFGDANAFSVFDLDKDFQDSLRFGLKSSTGLSDPNTDSIVDIIQDVNGLIESTGIIARDPNDDYAATHSEINTLFDSVMSTTDVQDAMRYSMKAAYGNDANEGSLAKDVNNLIVNYTAARAGYLDNINNALLLELGLSEIGDKVVADLDANSTSFDLSAIGDKVVADMDANSILADWTNGGRLDLLIDYIVMSVLLNPPTTIATLTSQTEFTLTAGSTDDDAYNDCFIVIQDASTSTQVAVGTVKDYTGSTQGVILYKDPGIFTMATTDKVIILPIKHVRGNIGRRGGVVK